MMTCGVLISNREGSSISIVPTSFVSECLLIVLHLLRLSLSALLKLSIKHSATITGLAGLSHGSSTQSVCSRQGAESQGTDEERV